MSDASILPPSATASETALEAAVKLGSMPLDRFAGMRNVEQIDADLMPWLAWEWSVDAWEVSWAEGQKRQALRGNLSVHIRKGTPASLKDALAVLPFPVSIAEGWRAGLAPHQIMIDAEGTDVRQSSAQFSAALTAEVEAIAAPVRPARCSFAFRAIERAAGVVGIASGVLLSGIVRVSGVASVPPRSVGAGGIAAGVRIRQIVRV